MILHTETGQTVVVGPKIAEGGEGTIFEVKSDRDQVAKLYRSPISSAKLQKLRCMISMRSTELSTSSAWVNSILLEGHVAKGVLLPRIADAHDIHMLYGPSHRAQCFPSADWPALIRVAANCCVVFDKMHRAGVVVGDINHSNVLVSKRDWRVWLIDCDSFQVTRNGEQYLCEVGVPEFTPPELQARSFTGIRRTEQQDAFGLALLIFHLLMMGRHPFAGRCEARDVTLDQAIRQGLYAYSKDAQTYRMLPPPRTVSLQALPDDIRQGFELSFRGRPQDRPTPERWYLSLTALLKSITTCSSHSSHKFWSGSKECPWCTLLRAGVPEYFVQVVFQRPNQNILSKAAIDKRWAEFQAVAFPTVNLDTANTSLRPSPEVREVDLASGVLEVRATSAVLIVGLIAVFFGLVTDMSPLILCGTIVTGVFFIWYLLARLRAPHLRYRNHLKANLYRMKVNAETIEREHQNWLSQKRETFNATLRQAEVVRQQLVGLPAKQSTELSRLEQQKREFQLHDFLRTKFLETSTIQRIGPSRQAILLSYGIETAADVTPEAILSVPGFGMKLTEQLVSWRRQLELSFRFDPSKGVPETAKRQIRERTIQEQDVLLKSLDQRLGDLRAIVGSVNARHLEVQKAWSNQQSVMSQISVDLIYLRDRKTV